MRQQRKREMEKADKDIRINELAFFGRSGRSNKKVARGVLEKEWEKSVFEKC